MMILSLEVFMKKYSSKIDNMNESDLEKIYIYNICHRDSEMITDKGIAIVNIDNGQMGITNWTCFLVKDKPYYFDSFDGQPNKPYLNNYQNQYFVKIKKHQLKKLDYADLIVYTFFLLMERIN